MNSGSSVGEWFFVLLMCLALMTFSALVIFNARGIRTWMFERQIKHGTFGGEGGPSRRFFNVLVIGGFTFGFVAAAWGFVRVLTAFPG